MKIITTRYGKKWGLEMLEALLNSMARNMPGQKLTILSDVQHIPFQKNWPADSFEVVSFPVDDYGPEMPNFGPFCPKTELVSLYLDMLPDGETVLFMDGDCIVLHDLATIAEYVKAADFAYTPRPGKYPLNTGVFYIKASDLTRRFAQRWAQRTREWADREREALRIHGGVDQASLSDCLDEFGHEIHAVPMPYEEWNLCQDWHKFRGGQEEPRPTRVVHLKGWPLHDKLSRHMLDDVEPFVRDIWNQYRPRKRWEEILRRLPADAPSDVIEIGTWHGDTALGVLAGNPHVQFWAVDPYRQPDADSEYVKSGCTVANRKQAAFEAAMENMLKRTKPYHNRLTFIRETSECASRTIQNVEFFDLIYIDADHSYAGCKADIALWADRVAPGGILCGHDYEHPFRPDFGVERAVDEFAQGRGLTVEVGDDLTWFIRMP